MISFRSFHGTVKMISDLMRNRETESVGCYKLMNVENEDGSIVNFVISPNTYFVDHAVVTVGDRVTGYYDGNAPTIMIYPPQYQALVVAKHTPYYNVKVDYFNSQLVSSDGTLKLNIAPSTKLILTNNQPFTRNPANRNLIVVYGASTKSIPAQTTPSKIIVFC